QMQQDGQYDRNDEGENLPGHQGQGPYGQRTGADRHVCAKDVGTEHHERKIHQQDRYAHGRKNLDLLARIQQRLNDDLLHEGAQREQDDHHGHESDIRMDAQVDRHEIDEIHADHQELAMGEVHDTHHPEDEREPQADDGVDATQKEAVDEQLKKDVHG